MWVTGVCVFVNEGKQLKSMFTTSRSVSPHLTNTHLSVYCFIIFVSHTDRPGECRFSSEMSLVTIFVFVDKIGYGFISLFTFLQIGFYISRNRNNKTEKKKPTKLILFQN